jgi:two-component system OmpR family response regulator
MTHTPLSILYVDDDEDIRTIVQMSLTLDPAISLELASSGEAALVLVDDRPTWRPDALILDVMMPGLSGLETLAEMRRRDRLLTVPAIFMTARGRAMEQSQYLTLGAAGTILKPFDPVNLAMQIRTMLSVPDA